METVYKLVKRVDDKLVSIRTTGKAQIEYKIGEWSQAPGWLKERGYDLCVFKELEAAKKVQCTWEIYSILFECEAENVHYTDQPYLSVSQLSEGKIEARCTTWPSLCTIMAERVRPVKEIS